MAMATALLLALGEALYQEFPLALPSPLLLLLLLLLPPLLSLLLLRRVSGVVVLAVLIVLCWFAPLSACSWSISVKNVVDADADDSFGLVSTRS
jgi:hypothetical protein